MPELPEAETIARGLHAALASHRVQQVRIHRREVVEPMSTVAFRRALTGRLILSVGRRAKWIVATLDDGCRWVTQLRMTGRFTWAPAGRLRVEPHLSVSLLIASAPGQGVLRFYDVRRFARMWALTPAEWSKLDERLGIEPLSPAFTPKSLSNALGRSRAPIRNVLLDQARIAGIGNIYASEACHTAQIDPRREAGSLARSQIRRLHAAIQTVLEEAVGRSGTSFSDYRDVLGGTGGFQDVLAVYGREGEECRRCGGEIERVVLAGRSAFFCARCQS
jgi:formamidopyrimidine-DNA glycosylase